MGGVKIKLERHYMAKLRIQVPYTKFGVIEISEIEVKDLEKGMAFAKEFIKKHSSELAVSTNTQPSTDGVKLSKGQWGFIKNNGGDVNKKFKNWDEVNTYIDSLKTTEVAKPTTKVDETTPWDLNI